jgi:hypothetical protein
MAYTITKSDGTTLPTIPDGTIDTSSTNLSLPGPNFVGYGQYLNQNLVHLLENFSSNSTPAGTNIQGQLWFDKFHQRLNVFTVNGFVPVSGITNSGTPPVITNDGEFWFDTYNNQFYVSNAGTFHLVGPQYTKSQGVSGAIPITVNDAVSGGITHSILQLQFGKTIVATVSTDSFTPKNYDPGFPVIYSGITINGNINSSQLQPQAPSTTFSSDTINAFYVNTTNFYSPNVQITGGGITGLNTLSSTYVSATNFSTANAQITGGTLSGITSAQITGGTLSGINTLTPSGNTLVNLGSASNRWATVYGVSSSALYADLAENYVADADYAPGTVLMFGGDKEVTLASDATTAIAGVVSTKPAYLMNDALTGQHVTAIALIGRVPCSIIGPVVKGDLLVSAGNGHARRGTNIQMGQVIGRSLENVPENTTTIAEIVIGRIG